MKTTVSRYSLCIGAAAAMLVGCNSQIQTNAPAAIGAAQMSDASRSMAHYTRTVTHLDRSESWMQPGKSKGPRLYVGDWNTNDVYVYDFPSGQQIGTLTGFSDPYGMCVDSEGDVYITNFNGGTLVEYAYGASKPKNIYATGGEPIGCSVSKKGDVSSTSFSPGEVVVYAKGNPKNARTYGDSSCEYIWTMGYDAKGDLAGVGEYSRIDICALLAGEKSETVLTENGGIIIDFPGGTSWDGKYIAVGDQEAHGSYQTGMWPAKISGTTITAVGKEIVLQDHCYGDYVDDVNPFFLGKGFVPITPASTHRAKYVIGPNSWCQGSGGGIHLWFYPSGKLDKYITLEGSGGAPYGVAVSDGPQK